MKIMTFSDKIDLILRIIDIVCICLTIYCEIVNYYRIKSIQSDLDQSNIIQNNVCSMTYLASSRDYRCNTCGKRQYITYPAPWPKYCS